ncbi:S-layer family protein [Moorena producens JHB]|uniref:S-layer family protein n=1 Tax=Moorena producens (strain JHB) TaxID=1454205 RepID=A0A1D9FWK9_MOOP1|nr:S-layer family protein [Moorena producens]AOY79540.2 S-layer family protein [Moorena producens JHB]
MKPWIYRLVPASSVVLSSLLGATTALGQITPDNTLGNESSVVTPNVNLNGNLADLIEGGAIRDSNLFHSFSDFNVAEFGRVYFANPAGIANILSRVTGGNVSNILGTLGVLGNANLFVINPNGIFFGPNSRLDLGGSFFGSTADSVLFEDGTVFSTLNPNETPLLTINIPSGLQYGSNPAMQRGLGGSPHERLHQEGSITNQSSLFQVPNGQTLGLIGGEVNIPGGALGALDGRIELGSVGSNSLVKLTPTDSSFLLDYSAVQGFQDISLSEGAFVTTSGESGGSIQVQGANVSLRDRSFVVADTEGSQNGGGIVVEASQLSLEGGSSITTDVTGSGQGGDLTVDASSTVQVIGNFADGLFTSSLFAATLGTGDAGDLSITTGKLIVKDGAVVSTTTGDEGDGGNLTVDASEKVQLIGTSGDGQFVSGLFTQSESTGNAGELNITTGQLIVKDGAQVSASTIGEGDGGNLTVDASEKVQLIGTSGDGQFVSGLFTQSESTKNAGELNITTGQLIVKDGAQVSASTIGEGNGGNLTVNADSTVQLIGTSASGESASGLFAQANQDSKGKAGDVSITTGQLMVSDGARVSASTVGEGDGGDVNITTGELIVSDGAQVLAVTAGEGDGGNLTVNADSTVQLIGTSADDRFPSALANLSQGTGKAGELSKITTGQLTVSDGAGVSAQSNQQGSSAGTVEINANSIFLNNNGIITAETAGPQGNITLYSRDIRLLNESKVITNAENTTTGGNITIDTDTLVGLGNSDITANAQQGRGGSVTIKAKGIFGLEFRDHLTPENDITATSELGPSFRGQVTLNILQVDPTSGLTELPGSPVDAEAILANDLCGFENNRIAGGSSFTITGKGGLPASADDPVINSDTTVGWRTRPGKASTRRQQLQQLQQQPNVRRPLPEKK